MKMRRKEKALRLILDIASFFSLFTIVPKKILDTATLVKLRPITNKLCDVFSYH